MGREKDLKKLRATKAMFVTPLWRPVSRIG